MQFDSAQPYAAASGTSHSWPHTCTGPDGSITVFVIAGNSARVPTATYAGVSMTQVAQNTDNASFRAFHLANPTPGTNNVVVTLNLGAALNAISISHSGVEQVNPVDAVAQNQNELVTSPTSYNASITTTAPAWIISACANNLASGTNPNAGTNNTVRQRSDSPSVSSAGRFGVFDTNGPLSAGVNTVGFAASASQYRTLEVALKPAPENNVFRAPSIKAFDSLQKSIEKMRTCIIQV